MSQDLVKRMSLFVEATDEYLKKKGGGTRKRRTAYSSGRRELLGFRRKKIVDLSAELKKALNRKKKTKKSFLSNTGFRSKQRWKTYDGRK